MIQPDDLHRPVGHDCMTNSSVGCRAWPYLSEALMAARRRTYFWILPVAVLAAP